MSRHLILLLSLLAGFSAHARPQWGGGLGMDLRMQREVNPDFSETKAAPQVFGQMLFVNWGAHLEAGQESQTSGSGGLTVSSRSYNVGAWGRYKFVEQKRWRPFASAGVGAFLDRVTSKFGTAATENRGERPYLGTGGGMAVIFWNHMLLESEGRILLVRERKEPMISALLRIGFIF